MMSKFYEGWYVLYVKSRFEKMVDLRLKQQGFESYLPLVRESRKWNDRLKIVYKPLFPSYVFVYAHNQTDFSGALRIDGVCNYIKFGNDFARVHEDEINNVKLLLDANLSNIETTSDVLRIGEVRKIKSGPLSGLECRIVSIDDVNKIVVYVESIHTNVTATLPVDFLYDDQPLVR